MGLHNESTRGGITELSTKLVETGNIPLRMSRLEVDLFEQKSGITFPKSYRDFLLLMGKGAGKFLVGSDIFFDEIGDLQEAGRILLEENNLPAFDPNLFVFWMHQGYQMMLFDLNSGDDPIVYYYNEASTPDSFVEQSTFLDFLWGQFDLFVQMTTRNYG